MSTSTITDSTTTASTITASPILTLEQVRKFAAYRDDVLVELASRKEVLGTELNVVEFGANLNKQGRVVAVGPEQRDVTMGDWIWFASQSAVMNEIKAGGKTFLVLQPGVSNGGRILAKRVE